MPFVVLQSRSPHRLNCAPRSFFVAFWRACLAVLQPRGPAAPTLVPCPGQGLTLTHAHALSSLLCSLLSKMLTDAASLALRPIGWVHGDAFIFLVVKCVLWASEAPLTKAWLFCHGHWISWLYISRQPNKSVRS